MFEPLLSPIALMVSRVDHFISEAKSYSDSDERLEFNKEIDNFITDNKIWIKARARTNLRITGGVFGDAELQAEVHKVIQVILANKIQPDHDYDIAGILLSLIPFIGSAELLYEGARNNNLMEFLSGALFLSLDTLMFINSPLRAAMTPEELTIEASSRTNDLQSFDEKIQLKSLAHVSKQLHADNDVIENLFKNRELSDNTQHILKEPGFCLVPQEQKALAQEVIQEANKADSAPKLWRGYKVVLLEKEQRVIPMAVAV